MTMEVTMERIYRIIQRMLKEYTKTRRGRRRRRQHQEGKGRRRRSC